MDRMTAVVWIALLTWRSPPRLRRCLTVLPEEAGSGAVPLQRAKAASCLQRVGSQARSLAAEMGPMSGSSRRVSRGTDELGECVLVAFGVCSECAWAGCEVAHDAEHDAFLDIAGDSWAQREQPPLELFAGAVARSVRAA